ncbi:hypothetical protein [Nitrosopumilus sp.]|uniref:hypothetical protein n=1 Tax=Nitrosopumilus sp. TaxID=2024843 RepID=UPI002930C417|nr:hypothetical protein [Nitrosopumilus sp.]
MVRVSSVLPETLVTTSVSESTVFGKMYPFTIEAWMFVFDKIDAKIEPIAPEPPIPAKRCGQYLEI